MVKETRLLFDLNDILALRVTCDTCSGEISFAVPVGGSGFQMRTTCPHCGQVWRTTQHRGPTRIESLMRGLVELIHEETPSPYKVKIEIEGDSN